MKYTPVYPYPFRKSRARKMYEVLSTLLPLEEGNHKITLSKDGIMTFSYRGTPIVRYDFKNSKCEDIDAGKYENTESTKAQRRAIYEAIEEFESYMFT